MTTKREREYLESYREINWTMLIVWFVIALISIGFAYLLGYVAGEYVIPFLQELTFTGWLGSFLVVIALIIFKFVYEDIKSKDNDLWGKYE